MVHTKIIVARHLRVKLTPNWRRRGGSRSQKSRESRYYQSSLEDEKETISISTTDDGVVELKLKVILTLSYRIYINMVLTTKKSHVYTKHK